MAVSSDKRLEVAYDHYKEVFKTLASTLTIRIRLIVLVLSILLLMVYQGIDPANAQKLLSGWIAGLTGNQGRVVDVLPFFVSLLLWFALCSLAVQTFQKSLLIEKQASYLRGLEAWLDELLEEKQRIAQIRYRRPKFFSYANHLYFGGFLLLIGSIGLWKLAVEILLLLKSPGVLNGVLVSLDLVLFGVTIYFCRRFVLDYRFLTARKD